MVSWASLSKADVIIICLVTFIVGYVIAYAIYSKFVLKEWFATSICKDPQPPLLDYIDTNYPYYDPGSLFRPLDTLDDSNQFVDFEQTPVPSLYM